jgi:hypothetical protein
VRRPLLDPQLLHGARVVMLVLIDGLGSFALRDAVGRGDVPGLAGARHATTLTSVFPSTTAAATTSVQYGIGPGTHGMAGYTLYLPQLGDVLNMITWRVAGSEARDVAPPDPRAMIRQRHVYGILERAGIDTVIVSNTWFEQSPLTQAQAHGVRYRGYRTPAEFAYRLLREVERPGKRFVFGYWDGFDALGHSWGSDAAVARLELRLIDQALREGLLAPLRQLGQDVALIVTADHGHTSTPRAARRDLAEIPGLLRGLARRPSGEPRQLGLSFRQDAHFDINVLRERQGDSAAVIDAAEAVAAGLYGPPPHHPELPARIGETLLLARDCSAFGFPGGHSGSVGGHGSLTPEEMLVPLLVWRFGRG